MLKCDLKLILTFVCVGTCLSLTASYYNENNTHSPYYSQDAHLEAPGKEDQSQHNQTQTRERATGREDVAYQDARDEDIHERANRKGDWGYKQNWRYDREAFYRGETQGEFYDEEHPDGVGGPGMTPDKEFLEMRKQYLRK